MSTKTTKAKVRHEKPKLRVMHYVEKNGDGSFSISSKVPKLKEAIGPDVQQAAEETGHKLPKAKPTKTEKPKDEMTDEQRRILKALDKLGGKDVGSMALAKEAGTVKTHPDAPRAPIRAAMEVFSKHGWVTRHKKGAGYLFSLTDKGRTALSQPVHKDKKDNPKVAMSGSELQQAIEDKTREEAAGLGPASNPSPTITDGIECPWCKTRNPAGAEFCKECGRKQPEAVQAAAVAS